MKYICEHEDFLSVEDKPKSKVHYKIYFTGENQMSIEHSYEQDDYRSYECIDRRMIIAYDNLANKSTFIKKQITIECENKSINFILNSIYEEMIDGPKEHVKFLFVQATKVVEYAYRLYGITTIRDSLIKQVIN